MTPRKCSTLRQVLLYRLLPAFLLTAIAIPCLAGANANHWRNS